jgi:hypothetical protein
MHFLPSRTRGCYELHSCVRAKFLDQILSFHVFTYPSKSGPPSIRSAPSILCRIACLTWFWVKADAVSFGVLCCRLYRLHCILTHFITQVMIVLLKMHMCKIFSPLYLESLRVARPSGHCPLLVEFANRFPCFVRLEGCCCHPSGFLPVPAFVIYAAMPSFAIPRETVKYLTVSPPFNFRFVVLHFPQCGPAAIESLNRAPFGHMKILFLSSYFGIYNTLGISSDLSAYSWKTTRTGWFSRTFDWRAELLNEAPPLSAMPVAPTAPPPLANPHATGVSVIPLLIWPSSEQRPEPSNNAPGRLPAPKPLLVTSSFSSILPRLRLVVRPVLVGWALATWKLDPRRAVLKELLAKNALAGPSRDDRAPKEDCMKPEEPRPLDAACETASNCPGGKTHANAPSTIVWA